jgi:hypothetical protein
MQGWRRRRRRRRWQGRMEAAFRYVDCARVYVASNAWQRLWLMHMSARALYLCERVNE